MLGFWIHQLAAKKCYKMFGWMDLVYMREECQGKDFLLHGALSNTSQCKWTNSATVIIEDFLKYFYNNTGIKFLSKKKIILNNNIQYLF